MVLVIYCVGYIIGYRIGGMDAVMHIGYIIGYRFGCGMGYRLVIKLGVYIWLVIIGYRTTSLLV